jgi:hypothetical protein
MNARTLDQEDVEESFLLVAVLSLGTISWDDVDASDA